MRCFYACHGCVMRSGPGRTRTYGVSLTVADLQSAPFAARGTDPYDYGHHTGVIINVWWPLAEVINQPRVVTRNTSVLVLVSSEWRDSNPRPPGPKPGALPSCATFRVVLYWQVCSSDPRSPLFCWLYNKGPKSKPDAVSRWKGDFQRFRYLSAVLYFPVLSSPKECREGLVGMLFSRRQNHTQTPDRGANVDFRSATPYVIPDHGVRRIRLIRAAGAKS